MLKQNFVKLFKNRENNIDLLFLFCIGFLYIVYSFLDVFTSNQMYIENGNRLFSQVCLIILIIVCLSYALLKFIKFKFKIFNNKKVLIVILFFAIFVALISLLSIFDGINSKNIKIFFNNSAYYLVDFLLLVSFACFARNKTLYNSLINFSFLIIYIYFGIMFFFFFRTIVTPLKTGFIRYPQLSHSFCVVGPFLFIRLLGSKKQIIVSYIFLMAIILLSIKRSLIIAFSLIVLIDIVVYFIKNKKMRINILIYSGFGLLFLLASVLLINYFTGGKLIGKFTFEELFSGSGRNEIWSQLFDSLANFTKKELIFGKGVAGVSLFATNGLGAHNDFLEYLYDFGLIGLISFTAFLVTLFVMLLKRLRFLPSYFLVVIFSVLVLVSSIFSNTNILIFAFCGFILAQQENQEASCNVY